MNEYRNVKANKDNDLLFRKGLIQNDDNKDCTRSTPVNTGELLESANNDEKIEYFTD